MNPVSLQPNTPIRFELELKKAARVVGVVVHPQGKRAGFSCEIQREGDTPFTSKAWTVITNSEAKPVAVLVWARVEYADGSTDLVPLSAIGGAA